ncbi:LysR family transcriptional regulator [Desulfovibrio sp.]|uniref:LysR family transcriptional regulator n=1 Tax=Desulfovibrio sp. TaxID=885 RepID=UPI0023C42519|nr:LysR family transcriptional regulator [Desulfovibrio sp.]MDE7241610.1 LysR family transcriptional regulator [Desulfovibrio sp.]
MLHPQWETLFLVVECGSFSRAAAARSCSAVAVMNQVNALEERLGVTLLTRSTRGVRLTEAGEALCAEARRLGEEGRRAVDRAREAGGRAAIRIGTSFLRPCAPLLARLEKLPASVRARFQINIVPFTDSPGDFARLQKRLGEEIDCFVSPCDSAGWREDFALLPLGSSRCCVALAAGHRLAQKARLTWADLEGETLLLVARGISPALDRLRDEIARDHPGVQVQDAPGYYDMEVFNRCAQAGYLMECPELWKGVHPSLVTVPVDWDYALPFGVVYAKTPSPAFRQFLEALAGTL